MFGSVSLSLKVSCSPEECEIGTLSASAGYSWTWLNFQITKKNFYHLTLLSPSPVTNFSIALHFVLAPPLWLSVCFLPLLAGYHHSLPSSPYSTGPEGQRLPSSGTLSSEFLNQGVPVKILLLVCNAAGAGQHVVRYSNDIIWPFQRIFLSK